MVEQLTIHHPHNLLKVLKFNKLIMINFRRNSQITVSDKSRKSPFGSFASSCRSLYSSVASLSLHLESGISSADSEEVEEIIIKTKKLSEYLTDRLSALNYFSKIITSDSNLLSTSENEESLRSSEQPSNKIDEADLENIKSLLETILTLKKSHEKALENLKNEQSELKSIDQEFFTLKNKLNDIEVQLSECILERNEQISSSCKCLVF